MLKYVCLTVSAALWFAAPTGAWCPFCNVSGSTLSQEAAAASIILFGTPRDAVLDPQNFAQGSTKFDIEIVIKSHPLIEGRNQITIPKYLPQPDPKQTIKLLAFGDVFQDRLDIYRAAPFGPSITEYLRGAIHLKDKPASERLDFFMKYLNDRDPAIAMDAFMEFGYADYKDMRPIAEKTSSKMIIEWLRDPGLALSRLGLYASILGHCGKPEDAQVLRDILKDPKRRYSGGIDGVLAGIIMLDPVGGWQQLTEVVSDREKDFMVRHAALRSARFFWEFRPDIVDRARIAETMSIMLDQRDMADMVIEDLRKWSYWKPAAKILALLGNKEFDTLLMRRAIVRYLLKCPAEECPEASAFIAKERKRDKQYIDDIESLLNQEKPVEGPSNKSKSGE